VDKERRVEDDGDELGAGGCLVERQMPRGKARWEPVHGNRKLTATLLLVARSGQPREASQGGLQGR